MLVGSKGREEWELEGILRKRSAGVVGDLSLGTPRSRGGGAGQVSGCSPRDTSLWHPFRRVRALRPREPGRGGDRPEHAHPFCCG